jgi:hypothetical protein
LSQTEQLLPKMPNANRRLIAPDNSNQQDGPPKN